MTEFEQQVSEALLLVLEDTADMGSEFHSLAGKLAPRVAAAFLETVDGNDVQAQADFVAALKAVAP